MASITSAFRRLFGRPKPEQAPERKAPLILLRKASEPGTRWITVHPNGSDSKGQPVMIREDKSGTWRVVGGAGGKLNYLRLRGVRSEAEYRRDAADKAKSRGEAKAEQRRQEKEAGTYEARGKQREAVQRQRIEAERAYITKVAETLGWERGATDPPDLSGLSTAAANRAMLRHHRDLLKQADEAVEVQRRQLLIDAEARTQADIGEVPLESADPSTLSVEDLDPAPTGGGLGFAPNYGERAKERGLTEAELSTEKAEQAPQDDDAKARAQARKVSAAGIREELQGIRRPPPPAVTLAAADKAAELLLAQKRLKAVREQARQALKDVDSGIEPKAFVVEVSAADIDREVQDRVEQDLRTVSTRAFLDEIGKFGDYEHALGRHIGVGAYNAVNALALAAGGSAMVDRDVVDVLGVAGAAQVLARRLHSDLSADEMGAVKQAMEEFHRDTYVGMAEDAMREAAEWEGRAREIEFGAAGNGDDLAMLQEANARRRQAVHEARRTLGVALGEMETNAALVMALGQGPKDSVQVSLGGLPVEAAIQRARAIGLERGDYSIDRAGGNTFLTVRGSGMDRLAAPVNRDDLARVRGALDIIEGRHDEADWLPKGVANRPDLAAPVPAGAAPRLAEPFTPGGDIGQSIRDYIGGRTADGDPPADIVADLLSQGVMAKAPDRAAYLKALDEIAPLRDEQGGMVRAEAHQAAFEAMADAFVRDRYGSARAPLHRQQVPMDQTAVEALHRAFAHEPTGVAALKAVGDLTPQDQRALRDHFYANVAKAGPEVAQLRADLDALNEAEPEREIEDMFGRGRNPAWTEWQQKRDDVAEKLAAQDLGWARYAEAMGGPENAYAAMQDMVRSRAVKAFHEAYNRLNPDAPLKIGRTVVRGNLRHLDAVDPDARAQRMEKHRALVDSLRERVQGRYAAGSVADKLDRERDAVEAFEQSQMGMFGAAEEAPSAEEPEKPLAADERYTLGHAMERQLAAMAPQVGANFRAGKPTRLWKASMSGRFINQQRALKLLEHNKRLVLAQGVGSGKTSIALAGFTHLQAGGKAKRGLFLVPSIVQGQFSGEALRYLEPNKYRWHIAPGASRDERIAHYKDPKTDFSVVTHQAFRDDVIHMGAGQAGVEPGEMANRFNAMTEPERRDWIKGVLDKEGISYDYLAVDEGHNLLNRSGKENSLLANTVDALSYHVPYYVSASADPTKNDVSETYDVLRKMDPDRYADRAAFMHKYGVDVPASREALRHEMARHFYPGKIDPGVSHEKIVEKSSVTAEQRAAIDAVEEAAASMRLARLAGEVDVEAAKRLSPEMFDGAPPDQHEAIARRAAASVGLTREAAIRRILDEHPQGGKIAKAVEIARARRGKPGVVFARSRNAVRLLAERLQADGHRVVTITGGDSAAEKERKRLMFRPESGDAQADILICSDAGAVGLNAQRGMWLLQHDIPNTALLHNQRNGRIFRVGQENGVELIDSVADHPIEARARDRLAKKYELRDVVTSPLEGLDDTGIAGYLGRAMAAREQRNAA
jgi:superfamily II DNA or RNA helicase